MSTSDITTRELLTNYFAVQTIKEKTKATYQRVIEIYAPEFLDSDVTEITSELILNKADEYSRTHPDGRGKHSFDLFVRVLRALFSFYMKRNPGKLESNPTLPLLANTVRPPKPQLRLIKQQEKKHLQMTFRTRTIEASKMSTGEITIGELLTNYLAVKNLKERTKSSYQRLIEIYAPELLESAVTDITTELLLNIADEYSKTHSDGSGKHSFDLFVRVLRALFSFYMKRYPSKLATNPTLPLLGCAVRPQKRQSRLMKEQVKNWWSSVNALENDKARDYLKFLLLTGLPKIMATHLTWSQYEQETGTLKLESGSRIPLSTFVMELLAKRKALYPHTTVIFSTSTTDKLSEYDRSYQLVNEASGYQITPQALGRTFRAFALTNGITESIVLTLVDRTNDHASAYGLVYDIADLRKLTQQITNSILVAAGEIEPSSAQISATEESEHSKEKRHLDPQNIDIEALSNVLASTIAKGGDKETVAIIALAELSLERTTRQNSTSGSQAYRLNVAISKDYFNKVLKTIEQKEATILNAMTILFGSNQHHQISSVKITTQLIATEGWRKRAIEWVTDSKTNNQGKVRSDNLASITCDGLLFRSTPEVNLYKALKALGILFAPLPVFIRGGISYQRIEPDFVLIKDGIVLHVEVDGDSFHHESPTQAHDRAALIVREGAFIERVSAARCATPESAKECAADLVALLEKYKRSH